MTDIVVPELGESVVEARIARWLKKEGERVEQGEPVVELETEKIDLEVSAERPGVLASIRRREGEDVKIGELLATIDESASPSAPAAATKAQQASGDRTPPGPTPAAAMDGSEDGQRSTPAAKRMAKEHAVSLDAIQGTGPGGRVMKQDVQQALTPPAPADARRTRDTAAVAAAAAPSATATKPAPAPSRPPAASRGERSEDRRRMSKRRQTIARRLVEAQRTAAMLTTFNEVDMTELMALRERRKEAFKKQHGIGLGIASFFIKASVAALKQFPELNAEIQGDEIVLKRYYDVGVAVGAEGGLVVPVIRDADRLPFAGIELAIREFAQRAADGTLTLEDLSGGTFTITNGGVFGSLLSTPILNPPQVGILGLHKIEERAVPRNGQVAIRPMMYVALSYDHRIVDGREAVQFLVKVKELVEDPGTMLLES
jgi:2-oxoglutarate dehydrogenase E2 component (dihydrolipoamide succinyltransferase)